MTAPLALTPVPEDGPGPLAVAALAAWTEAQDRQRKDQRNRRERLIREARARLASLGVTLPAAELHVAHSEPDSGVIIFTDGDLCLAVPEQPDREMSLVVKDGDKWVGIVDVPDLAALGALLANR